ncbi:hypothetical protein WS95_13355 [Burkholderia sp. MSMB1826]|nr:hypothetical protein WS95_13355 [Burkholderia sp. MSMB1826]
MSIEVKKQIEALRHRMHDDSMSEVSRRALRVYDFVMAQQEQAAALVLGSVDGTDTRLPLLCGLALA